MDDSKPISAIKKRPNGRAYERKNRKGAANVLWKRITKSYDEEVRKFAANPALVSPITRWVLFQHLTPTQGMAGRRYADIVRNFQHFTVASRGITPRSANLEPTAPAEDNELERRAIEGSLVDYEDRARYAKRQYKRLMKVLDRFADPATGRNLAKDALDELCLLDKEINPRLRQDVAAVLSAVAKEFGLGEKKGKVR